MVEPISGSLELDGWDSEAAVAYEAAVEAINGVVGAYSALIAQEEQRSDPDPSAVAEWRRQRSECQQVRQRIDPDDAAQVDSVRREYAERLRQLHGLIG
ncbi:hypothetical protein ACFYWP_37040 [Actinacidiphila glaucinigra]|uniref:hypothetical protein n=1 Tax=Actinacidiphila glaucinigra TaxID=235986 RepID=UPI0036872B7C